MSQTTPAPPGRSEEEPPAPGALERGMATMRGLGIDPDGLRAAMQTTDPRFADTVIRFAFGDIVSRDELDLRTRQLVTVAVLTALGGCEAQLETHLPATLEAGATRTEVIHAILQTTPYAGIPRVINALNVVKSTLPHSATPAEPRRSGARSPAE